MVWLSYQPQRASLNTVHNWVLEQGIWATVRFVISITFMNITTEQLEEIFAKIIKEVKSSNFSNLSRDEKIKLAKDPNTSPKTLEFLASDENSYVRYWVANNPNTPKYIKMFSRYKNYLRCYSF